MSNFQKILNEFRRLGYNQDSYLQENQALRTLDTIASQNTNIQQFDRSIAEQLWTHSTQNTTGRVKVRDYVNTLVEAEGILRQQINKTEGALKIQTRAKQKSQLQQQYDQIIKDHNMIALPFRLTQLRQAQPTQNSRLLQTKTNNQNQRLGESVIFSYQPNTKQQSSTDLKICLFLATLMALIQLVLMFHKHHFLNILCIFGVLSIFFLNYFDKNYIKFLLVLILTSLIFDIVWLGVNARQYWNPNPQTQHSSLHSAFLAFIFIMVVVMMVLKIIVLGILFKYRENPESFKKSVSVLGYRIKLDGRPTYNPFSPLLRAAPHATL